ncbi:MAG: hypothetical protein ABH829_05225 [archaeon]
MVTEDGVGKDFGRGFGYVFLLVGSLFLFTEAYNLYNNIKPSVPFMIYIALSVTLVGLGMMYVYRKTMEHFAFHAVWMMSMSATMFLTQIDKIPVFEFQGTKLYPVLFVFIFWWMVDTLVGNKLE